MAYHYDKDSFLAGLAVGRALWRPEDHADWTCDPAYMVYADGTPLGRSKERSFFKVGNGRTIAVFRVMSSDYGRPETGPVLISTEADAVRFRYTTMLGGTSPVAGYTRTFQKLGLRWYYNPGSQYATTSDYAAGGRPIVYMDAGMTWEDFVERVFEQAHVRRF